MKSATEKRAAIYYRFSSAKDAQFENSQKRQEDRLKEYCQRKEWLVDWRGGDDSVSGDKDKPVLNSLRKAVEDKEVLIDVLVVASWDRLTRRGLLSFGDDVKWLEENEIELALVQDDKVYDLSNTQQHMELMFRVYEASSYLKSLSKNIRDGLTARFNRGELRWSNAPFGFDKDDNGGIIANEDIELVPKMFKAVLETGVSSAQPIMGSAKRYEVNGKYPSLSSVRGVLRNTVYIGMRTFGVNGTGRHGTIKKKKTPSTTNVNKLAESALEPIDIREQVGQTVSDQVFEAVQSVLDDNKIRRPKNPRARYKYSGLVRCSCGYKLTAEKRKGRVTYTCPRSKNKSNGCDVELLGRKSLSEYDVDCFVEALSNGVLSKLSFHKNVLKRMVKYVDKSKAVKGNTGIEAIREIERLKKRKAVMWEAIADVGDEDFDAANKQIKNISDKIRKLEEEVSKTDVEVDQLLNGQFLEFEIDGTGEYLNSMMALAKEGSDAETKPKAADINARLKPIYRKLNYGYGASTPVAGLLDELRIVWHKVGNRCRPRRVEAIWRASLATAVINTGSDTTSKNSISLAYAVGGTKGATDKRTPDHS